MLEEILHYKVNLPSLCLAGRGLGPQLGMTEDRVPGKWVNLKQMRPLSFEEVSCDISENFSPPVWEVTVCNICMEVRANNIILTFIYFLNSLNCQGYFDRFLFSSL